MTRRREVDAQWATHDTYRAAPRRRSIGSHPDPIAVCAMPARQEAATEAEKREAAIKVTDMAAGQHACELSVRRGVKRCTHPDHARDSAWAQATLDALDLLDVAEEPPAVAAPPRPQQPARLDRTAFIRPNWTWQDDAACRGEDLVLFFGADGERAAERQIREEIAKEICAACPVRLQCLDHATRNFEDGIWGGLDRDERRAQRRRQLRRENAA